MWVIDPSAPIAAEELYRLREAAYRRLGELMEVGQQRARAALTLAAGARQPVAETAVDSK
jgi:hypothetical protein